MGDIDVFTLNYNNGNELINNSSLLHFILIYTFPIYEYFKLHRQMSIITHSDDVADNILPHRINVCKMLVVFTILFVSAVCIMF